MPFLSVGAIGVVVGAVGHVVRGGDHAVWRGFFGAWAGFAMAALVGLGLDVLSQTGHWVPVLGHIGAAAGSVMGQRLELADDETGARS